MRRKSFCRRACSAWKRAERSRTSLTSFDALTCWRSFSSSSMRFERGVVDGLSDRLLRPGLAGDALELRGVEGIAGVLGVVAVVPQIAVDRRREATRAGALDQALDLREFRRQIFPELRGVQEACDVIDVGELVKGIVELLRLSELVLRDLQLRGQRLRPASSSRSAARTGARRRSGRTPPPGRRPARRASAPPAHATEIARRVVVLSCAAPFAVAGTEASRRPGHRRLRSGCGRGARRSRSGPTRRRARLPGCSDRARPRPR